MTKNKEGFYRYRLHQRFRELLYARRFWKIPAIQFRQGYKRPGLSFLVVTFPFKKPCQPCALFPSTSLRWVTDKTIQANELKDQGNKAFQAKDYDTAIALFTKAIELDSQNHVLFSNRSAAKAGNKQWTAALEDAEAVSNLSASLRSRIDFG